MLIRNEAAVGGCLVFDDAFDEEYSDDELDGGLDEGLDDGCGISNETGRCLGAVLRLP